MRRVPGHSLGDLMCPARESRQADAIFAVEISHAGPQKQPYRSSHGPLPLPHQEGEGGGFRGGFNEDANNERRARVKRGAQLGMWV